MDYQAPALTVLGDVATLTKSLHGVVDSNPYQPTEYATTLDPTIVLMTHYTTMPGLQGSNVAP